MEEEVKDVNVSEQTTEEEADTSTESETEDSSTSEDSDESESDNRIPHSRVKEMERKAYEKGRQEALKKLLADDDEDSLMKDETPSYKQKEVEQPKDEKAEAMKILREAIREEVKPLVVRSEVKEFLRANPDAVKYIDGIKEARKQSPGLSWDNAYKLASFDDKIKSAESKASERATQSVKAKEGARTEKPTATKTVSKASIEEQMKGLSIDKAAELLKKHLMGG